MTVEEIIISFVRIFASLIVFKFNFFGGLLVILIDFSDLFMMNLISLGGVRNYQVLDKFLDLFYISFFLLITLRWSSSVRNISIALFIFRIIGFILFEIYEERFILFLFPNVFEFWFIGIAFLNKFKKAHSRKNIVLVLFFAFGLKMFQEYILHVWRFLDNYRAVDVVKSFIDLFN
ncbi:MAG: hypothetical protein CL773_05660 [Chloroflexi bacterium]|nr:hypothetical protein [Chloroflexota bacterium]|tara:strand:+ start:14637 stop:15164 length:528 start_codon:yes stop_codon:yes gene_type:complete